MTRFMKAHAHYQDEQIDHGGAYAPDTAKNWMDILQYVMKQQYDPGNISGYLEYKNF